MKRIFLNSEYHNSLRCGLGLISEEELLERWRLRLLQERYPTDLMRREPCPKIYTTRTHKLEGEYYVVEGSRFKPMPVEPRIEFQIGFGTSWELNLKNEAVRTSKFSTWTELEHIFPKNFPELDLGVKNATFEDLCNELLKSYPKATLDTPFWVNKLEPIRGKP